MRPHTTDPPPPPRAHSSKSARLPLPQQLLPSIKPPLFSSAVRPRTMARSNAVFFALCALLAIAAGTAQAARSTPARELLQVSDCSRIPNW